MCEAGTQRSVYHVAPLMAQVRVALGCGWGGVWTGEPRTGPPLLCSALADATSHCPAMVGAVGGDCPLPALPCPEGGTRGA